MGSHGLRFEAELPLDQIAVLLHQTADGLAAGTLALGDDVHDLSGLRALDLGIELRGASARLRLKGKAQRSARATRPGDSYRALKKGMSHTWKALRRSARDGALPDPAIVQRFVEQGQAMMQHPDKGAAFFPAFTHALQALQRAADEGDAEAWGQALAQVDKLRKAAHRRYK